MFTNKENQIGIETEKMNNKSCRICFDSNDNLTEICSETRENFYLLTYIHLINSEAYSNFICRVCKDKLQSTRNFIRLLVENESRLLNESCQENPLNYELKTENEEFIVESDNVLVDLSFKALSKDFKTNSNPERKRMETEFNAGTSLTFTAKKLKFCEEKVQKLSPKSLKFSKESPRSLNSYPKSADFSKSQKSSKNLQRDLKFKSKSQSNLAVTTNGKIICPNCNRPILKSNYKLHITQKHSTDNSALTCDLCPKKFNQRSSLESHMHIHLNIKPNICPENCGKTFHSKHGLSFHHKMHHQKIIEFICEICAKTFKQSHLLQEHIDAQHVGVRYSCKYTGCGNRYNTVSGLRKHIDSIHECKIVPCEFCGEFFRTGFSLYQHIRINHKERKFVCEYEGCDKKFVIKTHYRDHLKMHTGKKDFICKLCDASYHKNRNLTRHIQVVHQKSRFFCQVDGCNASLCNKDNYRAHLRKVHAGDSEVKDLLAGIAKMKPVFMDSVGDLDAAVVVQN